MKYKITIQELIQNKEDKYPTSMSVYEQVIEDTANLLVQDVIKAVNGI